MTVDERQLASAVVEFHEGSPPLVRITLREEQPLDAEKVQELLDLLTSRIVERSQILVDSRGLASMTREARELAAGDQIVPFVHRIAVLVGSPVSTIISNFVIHVSRPRYPISAFTDEASAMAWLSDASRGHR